MTLCGIAWADAAGWHEACELEKGHEGMHDYSSDEEVIASTLCMERAGMECLSQDCPTHSRLRYRGDPNLACLEAREHPERPHWLHCDDMLGFIARLHEGAADTILVTDPTNHKRWIELKLRRSAPVLAGLNGLYGDDDWTVYLGPKVVQPPPLYLESVGLNPVNIGAFVDGPPMLVLELWPESALYALQAYDSGHAYLGVSPVQSRIDSLHIRYCQRDISHAK